MRVSISPPNCFLQSIPFRQNELHIPWGSGKKCGRKDAALVTSAASGILCGYTPIGSSNDLGRLMAMKMIPRLFGFAKLDDVFSPGGQPTITYVDRAHLNIESNLNRAIALPTTIVALTGPTKCGKTVLCTRVLSDMEYVWIDGGQVKKEADLWTKVCTELRLATELTEKSATGDQAGASATGGASAGIPGNNLTLSVTINGSRLRQIEKTYKYLPDNMHQAIEALLDKRIILVIDDFHYIDDEVRISIIRSLKGAVYRGLKVILLSTPHRAFEAIKAEAEITGRFKHVTVPVWSTDDLSQIGMTGFHALNVDVGPTVIEKLAIESQGSPLLMQRFCWSICFDENIKDTQVLHKSLYNIDIKAIFNEVAEDAGLPTYEKLAKGPQSRTERIPRPLYAGGTVDIYEAILLAVANTGPKERISYDLIRSNLNSILSDKVPQKIEVSNALKYLTEIDERENKSQRAIDWDAENLDLFLTDPFLRFYLRWKISTNAQV
ncbi:hypothetical protein ACSBOB_19290 [Mesorhizobium sp. ASY16-5R]|uniref:hypothetical protein n=1 Tax=Mesorhizobium sp. ASY16-5R TaxID=3445772 RepID=UPI003FA0A6E7